MGLFSIPASLMRNRAARVSTLPACVERSAGATRYCADFRKKEIGFVSAAGGSIRLSVNEGETAKTRAASSGIIPSVYRTISSCTHRGMIQVMKSYDAIVIGA